jgi:hypothetical protein
MQLQAIWSVEGKSSTLDFASNQRYTSKEEKAESMMMNL